MHHNSPVIGDRDMQAHVSPTAYSEQSSRPSQSRRSTSDGAITSVTAEKGDDELRGRVEEQSVASPHNSESGRRRQNSADMAKDIRPLAFRQ
jgi:hypothetical protein